MGRFYSEYSAPSKGGNSARWFIHDRYSNEQHAATVYDPNLVQIIVDALNAAHKK